jgi:hypothetical protein
MGSVHDADVDDSASNTQFIVFLKITFEMISPRTVSLLRGDGGSCNIKFFN